MGFRKTLQLATEDKTGAEILCPKENRNRMG
jgi:hypothetical protein